MIFHRHFTPWLLAQGLIGALTTTACGRDSRSTPAPKGGDGKAELAQLRRGEPETGAIVVLGSSTAAGLGASRDDAAWVPRYRAHLAEKFPKLAVVNLAKGGYTTFEIQPASFVPPTGRPRPDVDRNIDAALRLTPRVIIINLPSNDQAAGYPWSEQLANLERVVALARKARVSTWLSTTQPRNFEQLEQRRSLLEARDAIQRRFAPNVADFYTPLVSGDTLNPAFDSGDGIHVNDAGHALLAQAIIQARIPESIVSVSDAAWGSRAPQPAP